MSAIGFDQEEIQDIYSILAAIILIGDIVRKKKPTPYTVLIGQFFSRILKELMVQMIMQKSKTLRQLVSWLNSCSWRVWKSCALLSLHSELRQGVRKIPAPLNLNLNPLPPYSQVQASCVDETVGFEIFIFIFR